MPDITFRILATAEQAGRIEDDFRALIAALGDDLDGDLEVRGDQVPDPELVSTWVEQFSDAADAEPTGTDLVVHVREFRMGSVSTLTMYFAELLTVRGEQPAEPLLRQVRDDPGTVRVPWHVQVTP